MFSKYLSLSLKNVAAVNRLSLPAWCCIPIRTTFNSSAISCKPPPIPIIPPPPVPPAPAPAPPLPLPPAPTLLLPPPLVPPPPLIPPSPELL
ncbi:hypothetical protein AX774_g8158 [Zancudomyces culisetae]|uniref:Uncharacterized protein n=1 Tax=Zancudomyces culisetae TaxID=1213189 RepID=A0A1R1PBW2_ZANCU|nr:hypothetical protein AX774_g8158 [Zancudomyces culisetae]|eukprot:OMH78456.1 hypothetical protein AX774_g8158 [Zancudomyces culisetae]